MHILNHKIRRHTQNRFPILGSSSLLVSTIKDLLFYSLRSPSLSSEWAPSWSQQEFLRWRTIKKKKKKKKLIFFLILYSHQKLSFFSLLFLSFNCHQNEHLPMTSHLKRESLNGLIGLLWKACWTKIFYWARRGTLWIYLVKRQ